MLGSRYDRGLLLAIVGTLLLLNPLYVYPDGGRYVQTYGFESTQVNGSVTSSLVQFDDRRVLECGLDRGRSCLLERGIGPNGTLVVDDASALDDQRDDGRLVSSYRYVHLDSGFYRPNATVSNGSVVLSLERVDPAVVASDVAVEYRRAPDTIQRAVDTGSASTTISTPNVELPGPKPEHELDNYDRKLVEKDGRFYAVRQVRYHSRPFSLRKHLSVIRGLGVLIGFGLVFLAFQLPNERS